MYRVKLGLPKFQGQKRETPLLAAIQHMTLVRLMAQMAPAGVCMEVTHPIPMVTMVTMMVTLQHPCTSKKLSTPEPGSLDKAVHMRCALSTLID